MMRKYGLFYWDNKAHGSNIYLDKSLFVTESKNASSHEWIRTTILISDQELFE